MCFSFEVLLALCVLNSQVPQTDEASALASSTWEHSISLHRVKVLFLLMIFLLAGVPVPR